MCFYLCKYFIILPDLQMPQGLYDFELVLNYFSSCDKYHEIYIYGYNVSSYSLQYTAECILFLYCI